MDRNDKVREISEVICATEHGGQCLSHCDFSCKVDCTKYAKALCDKGYHTTIWHKVAYHWDLPETPGQYLCIVKCRDKYFILSYDGTGHLGWRNRDTGDSVNPCFITAWAELPEYEE